MTRDYNVTLTVFGVTAENADDAVEGFEYMLGIKLPSGTVVEVHDVEDATTTTVEVERDDVNER